MKKINWLMIGLIAGITLLVVGLYVGDYFWVETYKEVPYQVKHIFGDDLAKYIIYDHISCGILAGLVIVVIDLYIVLKLKRK